MIGPGPGATFRGMDSSVAEASAEDTAALAVVGFLSGRIPAGARVATPARIRVLLGDVTPPDASALPDWAVVDRDRPDELPLPLLRQLLAQSTPVYVNEAFVVFARRRTFGLTDQRDTPEIQALAARIAGLGSAAPLPSPAPTLVDASAPASAVPLEAPSASDTAARPSPSFEEASSPLAAPSSMGIPDAGLLPSSRPILLPPEALAVPRSVAPPLASPEPPSPPCRLTVEPAAVTSPAAPPRPTLPAASPPWASGAAPPLPGLPARVAALLGACPARDTAVIGNGALAEALPAGATVRPFEPGAPLPAGAFDLVLLADPGPDDLAAALAETHRLLRAEGVLLVITENADSLGRRLARTVGREARGGLSAARLRAALRAASFRPVLLEGFSLDTWRAEADTAPPALLNDTAGALLEQAGRDAGPDHAAQLLLLASPV
ncbi:hypothetical protein [Muricoccus radiodurans]|uniref:hypothetical protein n=1 Tax=Muricoccus radiodurans TaxID=2231721 RepID=UPI003CEB8975